MAGPVELFFNSAIILSRRCAAVEGKTVLKDLVSGFHLRCPGDFIQYRLQSLGIPCTGNDETPTNPTRTLTMTYVVTESCIRCKLTDCVEVCPVDCFHEGPNFLVIDPEECIDCSLCEPECPVDAIFAEDDLPPGQQEFLKLNSELSLSWPVITEMKDAPQDADDWREVKEKRQYLER